jgi:hypothetical protein
MQKLGQQAKSFLEAHRSFPLLTISYRDYVKASTRRMDGKGQDLVSLRNKTLRLQRLADYLAARRLKDTCLLPHLHAKQAQRYGDGYWIGLASTSPY